MGAVCQSSSRVSVNDRISTGPSGGYISVMRDMFPTMIQTAILELSSKFFLMMYEPSLILNNFSSYVLDLKILKNLRFVLFHFWSFKIRPNFFEILRIHAVHHFKTCSIINDLMPDLFIHFTANFQISIPDSQILKINPRVFVSDLDTRFPDPEDKPQCPSRRGS